jgi:AcrR family transcriptional regulator
LADRPTPIRTAEESRQEIIETAAQCFMEMGYHATRIDDVAARMDSTKGRVYHHFDSKMDIYIAVHREGMDRLFEAVEPAMRAKGNGLEVLTAMLLAHAQAMMEFQALETVVAQGVQLHRFGSSTPEQKAIFDELIASRDRFEELFKQQLAAAAQDGSLGELDQSVTVKILLGALQWSIYWYRPSGRETAADRAVLAEKMVWPLVEGLRRRS